MIRRSGFVTMVGGALIVSACGRQVTPSPTSTSSASGVPAGFLQFKFRTVGAFDFSTYSYAVVFNTSGDGKTPIAVPTQNAFAGYSMAIVVSGAGGSVTATPYQYLRPNGQQNAQPIIQQVLYAPQDLRLQLNTNAQNTEFTVQFNRVAIATPQNATASPSPTPSPTASASPTASPTATPTATPSGAFATNWNYNYFVVQGVFTSALSNVQDSLGASPSGASDTTYTSATIDTTMTYGPGPFYPNPGTHASNAAATIQSGDIISSP